MGDRIGVAMGIAHSEWLSVAKNQPIGGTARVMHGRETRPNLQVGNEVDRYWAYCHACKTGGVVLKEHVRLAGALPPKASNLVARPEDAVHKHDWSGDVQNAIAGFLAHKNMDLMYLPEALYYSPSRKRLIIQTDLGEWLGRDLTGRSDQKWITYDNQVALSLSFKYDHVVIVEDPFSAYKVRWALSGERISVYASLGTRIHDRLLVRLLQHCTTAQMFYDGDFAGRQGADFGAAKLRGVGISAVADCAPDGLDPKDMSVLAIQNHCLKYRGGVSSTY